MSVVPTVTRPHIAKPWNASIWMPSEAVQTVRENGLDQNVIVNVNLSDQFGTIASFQAHQSLSRILLR